MRASFTLLIIALLVAGCARSGLEFKKERLTGEEYCITESKLLTVKNSEFAVLSLKYSHGDSEEKAPIKADLYIQQSGREYHINPHETLRLYIDGTPFILTVTSSFQDAVEAPQHHSIFIPTGTVTFGSIKEITIRQLLFFLPQDYLSKMVNAKRIIFEISSSSTNSSKNLQKYPVLLELNQDSISTFQEFKNKCVNNFLNQPGAD
ncbi:MAG: hypothetical protein K0R76_717 [Alphaproteobacteria bacterium]|jgi:hypothetical protein|nr:hypothetical protein [Alphaproteobacteria bacterium]